MNNELDNMDDLFDDNIGKSLRQMGLLFPRTASDFKKIEDLANDNNALIPERLKDPLLFLGKRNFTHTTSLPAQEEQNYSNKMAQAAREGKGISDEIRGRMEQDKLKSSQKKKDE